MSDKLKIIVGDVSRENSSSMKLSYEKTSLFSEKNILIRQICSGFFIIALSIPITNTLFIQNPILFLHHGLFIGLTTFVLLEIINLTYDQMRNKA